MRTSSSHGSVMLLRSVLSKQDISRSKLLEEFHHDRQFIIIIDQLACVAIPFAICDIIHMYSKVTMFRMTTTKIIMI